MAAPPVGAEGLEVQASVETISAIDANQYGYYNLTFSDDLSTAAYFAYDWERGVNGDLFVVDVAANTKRLVVVPASSTGLEAVAGSTGDGSTLLIGADWDGVEAGDADGGLSDAFLLDTATGDIELLTGALPDVSVSPLSMSDDGETILLAVYTSADEGSLYLSESGVLTELALPSLDFDTVGDTSTTLSADGSALLYSSRIGFQRRWHLRQLASGTETVVAAPSGSPSLSEDGSVVVASTSYSEINTSLSVWDTSTTVLRTLDVAGGAGQVVLNDAGTTAVSAGYSINNQSGYDEYRFELARIDIATGERQLLSTTLYEGLSILAIDDDANRIVAQGVVPTQRQIPVTLDELYGNYNYEQSVFIIDTDGQPAAVVLPGYVGSLDDQMARLYEAYFNRDPDAGGLTFWREQRAGGRSLDSVSDEFARSPEFIETYGALSDEAFVDLVYMNVLDRTPDAGGRAFWLDQLANGRTRGSLMTLFSESPEFIDATGTQAAPLPTEAAVGRIYSAIFGRQADEAGLANWVAEANRGVPLDDIVWYFMQTEEFQNMYGGLEGDPFSMIMIVYRNGMNRDIDDDGYLLADQHYSQGRPIEELVVEVTNSAAFVAVTSSTPAAG